MFINSFPQIKPMSHLLATKIYQTKFYKTKPTKNKGRTKKEKKILERDSVNKIIFSNFSLNFRKYIAFKYF